MAPASYKATASRRVLTAPFPISGQGARFAWLELRAGDPAGVLQTAIDAGLTRVTQPGHPY